MANPKRTLIIVFNDEQEDVVAPFKGTVTDALARIICGDFIWPDDPAHVLYPIHRVHHIEIKKE